MVSKQLCSETLGGYNLSVSFGGIKLNPKREEPICPYFICIPWWGRDPVTRLLQVMSRLEVQNARRRSCSSPLFLNITLGKGTHCIHTEMIS